MYLSLAWEGLPSNYSMKAPRWGSLKRWILLIHGIFIGFNGDVLWDTLICWEIIPSPFHIQHPRSRNYGGCREWCSITTGCIAHGEKNRSLLVISVLFTIQIAKECSFNLCCCVWPFHHVPIQILWELPYFLVLSSHETWGWKCAHGFVSCTQKSSKSHWSSWFSPYSKFEVPFKSQVFFSLPIFMTTATLWDVHTSFVPGSWR